jgi:hypothetical protein
LKYQEEYLESIPTENEKEIGWKKLVLVLISTASDYFLVE